jgi:hypothetical protein
VRNRAFSLRKKLQEFYEHESHNAPVRIELHKGSYCPHFVEHENSNGHAVSFAPISAPPVSVQSLLPIESAPILHETPNGYGWGKLLSGFTAGVLVTAAIAGAFYWLSWARASSDPVLRGTPAVLPAILAEAWGPILGPSADVLICVGNPPSFSVHSAIAGMPAPPASPSSFNDPGGRALPQELLDWYRRKYPTPDNYDHFLTITTNATYWGDSIGAMTALKAMISAGVAPQMFPEKVVTMPTLRRRNVVLFGAPEYSPAVAHFLEKCPLTVSYPNSIQSREGQFPATRYSTKRDEKNRLVQVYGLITVLPSESTTNHQHRTLIFSGVNSAGTQAAAEFFSSPENLHELRRHLKREGHDNFPAAYQVAVSAETDDNILLNFKYETHRVISATLAH